MLLVDGGLFTMGPSHAERESSLEFGWPVGGWFERIKDLVAAAGVQREVYVADFFIDQFEVTNRDYVDFVLQAGHRAAPLWRSHPHLSGPEQPVVGVSWFDADAYCRWAGKRLPSESEWEKAARGVDARTYPWGNEWDRTKLHAADFLAEKELATYQDWLAWRDGGESSAQPRGAARIGQHPQGASPYGVQDMVGNVWEWVDSWHDDTQTRKVLRGGGWDVPRPIASTWFRDNFLPPSAIGSTVTGFRCARDADGQMAFRSTAS